MDMYIRNRYCSCVRCKMNDMMGPALLVSFGTMALLANVTHGAVRGGTIVAVILIVIGAVKLLQGGASTEGHVPPGSLPAGAVPPVPPPAPTNTTSTTSEAQNG
jgi:hypothetical protein